MGMFNIGKQSIITGSTSGLSNGAEAQVQEPTKQPFGGKQHTFGPAGSPERKANAAKAAATRAQKKLASDQERARLLALEAAVMAGRTPLAAPQQQPLVAAPQVATAVAAPVQAAPAAPKAPKAEDKRSAMQQAFNFKLSVPEGTKVQVAGKAACNTTALAGKLALTYPSFGFVHGIASFDWVAVLTHRTTKTTVLVCAQGSTVTVCTQYPVQEIPADLANDLGLIEQLISSIAA